MVVGDVVADEEKVEKIYWPFKNALNSLIELKSDQAISLFTRKAIKNEIAG